MLEYAPCDGWWFVVFGIVLEEDCKYICIWLIDGNGRLVGLHVFSNRLVEDVCTLYNEGWSGRWGDCPGHGGEVYISTQER